MPQGIATGGNFLAPGRARTAGHPAPLNGGLQTENPIRFPSPKTLYVRKTGSDANGGDTSGAAAVVTGTDGIVDGTANFSAASGAFDASYVDRPINIVGVGRFRIEAVVSATQLTLSAPTTALISDQFGNAINPDINDNVGQLLSQVEAMSFGGTGGLLSYAEISVKKFGSPADNVIVQIRADDGTGTPSSSVLATSTGFAGASVTTSYVTHRFTFSSPPLLDGSTRYYVCVTRDGAMDDLNFYRIGDRDSAVNYQEYQYTGTVWSHNLGSAFRYRLGYSGATGLTWNVGGAVQTVGALLGNANDAVREGDTIYVGSGTYRETNYVWVAPKNGVPSPVSIIGDSDGAATGDSGMVQLTSYTTNDTTAPTDSSLLWFASGVSGFSFSKLLLTGASSSSLRASIIMAGASTNMQAASQLLTFADCSFLDLSVTSVDACAATPYQGYPLGWSFDRCHYLGLATFLSVIPLIAGGGADTDLSVSIKNCCIQSRATFGVRCSVKNGSGSAPLVGGIHVLNCTLFSGTGVSLSGSAINSTTVPITVKNCLIWGTNGLLGGVSGTITEDYNLIVASTPRGSVSVGAHSFSDGSHAHLIHFGQELQWGGLLRQFGEPMTGSPLAGFGNDGSQTAYDLRNQPRPAGGGNALPAIGALERSNTFAKETGTVHSGTTAISATGPAYQDFLVAVASGTSYTFSVYANYDANYTGTAPQLLLLNGTEAGVSNQTVTAGGSAGGGWTQVSLSPFAPTSDGFVTVRLLSNDTSGISEVVFDTFATS